MDEVATKICTSCNRALELNEFHVHRKSEDGHCNVCKDCRKRSIQGEKPALDLPPVPMRIRPQGGLLLAGYAREGEEVFK